MNTKKHLLYLLCISLVASTLLTSCIKDENCIPLPVADIRVPAEWEPQESVWMAWPTYDNKHDWSTADAYADIIKGLVTTAKLDLCIPDNATKGEVVTFLQSKGISFNTIISKIRFHVMDYADIWLRDTGPIFVKKGNNTAAVDFKFDGWGWGLPYIQDQAYRDGIILDESLDRRIAQTVGVPHISSPLIMEGGGLEFNGKGTVLVSEDVVLQRNPGWTKTAVELEFARLFGVKKVIWLKGYLGNDAHPVLNAPYNVSFGHGTQKVYTLLTTNGHTDEFVRFVDARTVLLAEPPTAAQAAQNPILAKSRECLIKTKQILSSSTNESGQPFIILPFPEVKPLYVTLDGADDMFNLMATLNFAAAGKQNINPAGSFKGVLAASYLNFLIINNVVLVAKYAGLSPDMAIHDAEAKQKLQQAFPGKNVIQVDVRSINVGGGGIHCITRQMPKLN